MKSFAHIVAFAVAVLAGGCLLEDSVPDNVSSANDSDPSSSEPSAADGDHGDVAPVPGESAAMPDSGTTTMDAGAKTYGPLLKAGLHPAASDALRSIGVTEMRIIQTIGNAPASAGTHAQDGLFNKLPYSAATDISIKGMTETQIKKFLDDLGRVGFAGWYRKPGYDGWPSTESAHVHAIWTGCPMKLSLRDQVRDWVVGKNGLVSHTTYTFYTWPKTSIDGVKTEYAQFNPLSG